MTSRIYQCIWFESGTLPKRCWRQTLNPKRPSCKRGRQNAEDGAPTPCFGGAKPSPAQLLTLRQKPAVVWASNVDVGQRKQHGTRCTHCTPATSKFAKIPTTTTTRGYAKAREKRHPARSRKPCLSENSGRPPHRRAGWPGASNFRTGCCNPISPGPRQNQKRPS